MKISKYQKYREFERYFQRGEDIVDFLCDLERGLIKGRAHNHTDYELYLSYYNEKSDSIEVPNDNTLYKVYIKALEDLKESINQINEIPFNSSLVFTRDSLFWFEAVSEILPKILNRKYDGNDVKVLDDAESALTKISLLISDFLENYNSLHSHYVSDKTSILIFEISMNSAEEDIFPIISDLNQSFTLISRYFSLPNSLKLISLVKGSWELAFAGINAVVTVCLLADKYILDRKKKQLEIQKIYLELQKVKLSELDEIEKSLKEKFIIDSEKLSKNIFDHILELKLVKDSGEEQESFLKKGIEKFVSVFLKKESNTQLIAERIEDSATLYEAFTERNESFERLILSEQEIDKISGEDKYVKLLEEDSSNET